MAFAPENKSTAPKTVASAEQYSSAKLGVDSGKEEREHGTELS